jgi:hypothetical protein
MQRKGKLIFRFLIPAGIIGLISCATPDVTRVAEYDLIPKAASGSTFSIVMSPDRGREDGFCFSLKNTGHESVFIDWEKSYLIINNIKYRCIHKGFVFEEVSAPQTITEVNPGSVISDCLFPEKNIEYNDHSQSWIRKPLESNIGEYSVAVICNGRQENLQGTFSMSVKEAYVRVNQSPSNTYIIYVLASVFFLCAILFITVNPS